MTKRDKKILFEKEANPRLPEPKACTLPFQPTELSRIFAVSCHKIQVYLKSAEDYEQLLFRSDQIKLLYPKFENIQLELELTELDSDVDLLERENFVRRYFQIMARNERLLKDSLTLIGFLALKHIPQP